MSDSLKVQPHHLERGAFLYVRQSSMRQVVNPANRTRWGLDIAHERTPAPQLC